MNCLENNAAFHVRKELFSVFSSERNTCLSPIPINKPTWFPLQCSTLLAKCQLFVKFICSYLHDRTFNWAIKTTNIMIDNGSFGIITSFSLFLTCVLWCLPSWITCLTNRALTSVSCCSACSLWLGSRVARNTSISFPASIFRMVKALDRNKTAERGTNFPFSVSSFQSRQREIPSWTYRKSENTVAKL